MKLTEAKLKEMIVEELSEASKWEENKSPFNYNSPAAANLVYNNRTDNKTDPIPGGYIRMPYVQPEQLRQSANKGDKRAREANAMNFVFYLPGYKLEKEIRREEDFEEFEREKRKRIEDLKIKRDQELEKVYDKFGREEIDSQVDFDGWYKRSSAIRGVRDRFVGDVPRLDREARLTVDFSPEEKDDRPVIMSRREIRLYPGQWSLGPTFGEDLEPQYIDFPMRKLKSIGVTNDYGEILDANGKVIANKRLQKFMTLSQPEKSSRRRK